MYEPVALLPQKEREMLESIIKKLDDLRREIKPAIMELARDLAASECLNASAEILGPANELLRVLRDQISGLTYFIEDSGKPPEEKTDPPAPTP